MDIQTNLKQFTELEHYHLRGKYRDPPKISSLHLLALLALVGAAGPEMLVAQSYALDVFL